jgi:hypothetical protein
MTSPVEFPPPVSPYDVTCHTEGCENKGITLRVMGDAATPIVLCGPCREYIIDVVPVSD